MEFTVSSDGVSNNDFNYEVRDSRGERGGRWDAGLYVTERYKRVSEVDPPLRKAS